MATACLYSEIEDCDPMRTASAHRFSRIVDYETMRMVSSYLCRASANECSKFGLAKRQKIGPDHK